MFLKSLIIKGFKSFEKETVFNFENGIIGIIGSNGSGKSNIIDAIEWVLSTTSMSKLRSKNSDDIIFKGTDIYNPANMAEVTIIFDNVNKVFDIEYSEVELTRRVYRDKSSNEYYINNTRVPKKKIYDLISGTGIAKNSLSIISQGRIRDFIEKNSFEKRILFNEVSGISRYNNRKLKSLHDLDIIEKNYQIIFESGIDLKKNVPKLKKQAEKTNRKNKIIKILNKSEKNFYANKINKLKNKIKEIEKKTSIIDTNSNDVEEKLNLIYDKLQEKLKEHNLIIEKIDNLNYQKNKIDKNILIYDKIEGDIFKTSHSQNDFESQKNKLIKNIETHEIRKNILSKELKNIENKIIELRKKLSLFNDEESDINEKNRKLNQFKIKLLVTISSLEKKINVKNNYGFAAKTFLQYKKNFIGVYDTIGKLLKPNEKYYNAYEILSRGISDNIIIDNKEIGRKCINFLKKNDISRLVFVPINDIKPKTINYDFIIALKEQKGYIGTFNEFILTDDKFKIVNDYFFGNTILVDNLENAINISNFINNKYKIITIETDLIYPGGVLSGGKIDKSISFNITEEKKNISKLKLQVKTIDDEIRKISKFMDSNIFIEANNNINKCLVEKTRIVTEINSIDSNLYFFHNEYKNFTKKEYISNISTTEKQKIYDIGELKNKQKKIINNIMENLSFKQKIFQQKKIYENEYNDLKIQYGKILDLEKNKNFKIKEYKIIIGNYIDIITNKYQITEEYLLKHYLSKEKISQDVEKEIIRLNNELKKIGDVNPFAIDEYNKYKEKYDSWKKNVKDINDSKVNIKNVITELDNLTINKIKTFIDKINKIIPSIFKIMFNGGKIVLTFSNKNDIVNSGIDIKVLIPGKKITNLNLLSGGEKCLVTLAVLFAVLEYKMLPLCILDEADAELDENNIIRFLKYLKKFSKKTQFLIITHRNLSMEKCDYLWGIVMEEKGISKKIAVNINKFYNKNNKEINKL